MAKQGKNGKSADRAEWRGFANVPLTADMKKSFEKRMSEGYDFWADLGAVIQDGYKMSIAYNAQNDAWSAALTCTFPQSVNSGLTMTALAPDAATAMALVLYKHGAVCMGVWPTETSASGKNQWG